MILSKNTGGEYKQTAWPSSVRSYGSSSGALVCWANGFPCSLTCQTKSFQLLFDWVFCNNCVRCACGIGEAFSVFSCHHRPSTHTQCCPFASLSEDDRRSISLLQVLFPRLKKDSNPWRIFWSFRKVGPWGGNLVTYFAVWIIAVSRLLDITFVKTLMWDLKRSINETKSTSRFPVVWPQLTGYRPMQWVFVWLWSMHRPTIVPLPFGCFPFICKNLDESGTLRNLTQWSWINTTAMHVKFSLCEKHISLNVNAPNRAALADLCEHLQCVQSLHGYYSI